MTQPETPTLERMIELRPRIDEINEFLDWLGKQGYSLAGYRYHSICYKHSSTDLECRKCCEEMSECWGMDDDCTYIDIHECSTRPYDRMINRDKLLSKFFEIDMNEVEREKLAVLDHVREVYAQ